MVGSNDPVFMPTLVLWLVLLVLLVPILLASIRLSHRLREKHPEVWRRLGEPTFAPIATSFREKSPYRELQDRVVKRWLFILKSSLFLYLVSFVGYLVLVWS